MTVLLQTLKEVHCNAPTIGVWVSAALAVMLLFFSGFASASEIAFFSLSPNDLNDLDPERNDNDRKIQCPNHAETGLLFLSVPGR